LDLLDSDAMAAEETRMRKAIHNVAEASIVIKVSQLFILTEKVFRAILAENSFFCHFFPI
jgi:N-acetylglucosamine-6-phosphate deacetylase